MRPGRVAQEKSQCQSRYPDRCRYPIAPAVFRQGCLVPRSFRSIQSGREPLPDHWKIESTIGVSADAQDHIWISNGRLQRHVWIGGNGQKDGRVLHAGVLTSFSDAGCQRQPGVFFGVEHRRGFVRRRSLHNGDVRGNRTAVVYNRLLPVGTSTTRKMTPPTYADSRAAYSSRQRTYASCCAWIRRTHQAAL